MPRDRCANCTSRFRSRGAAANAELCADCRHTIARRKDRRRRRWSR